MQSYIARLLPLWLGLSSCQVDTADLEQFLQSGKPSPLNPQTDPVSPLDAAVVTESPGLSSRDPFSPVKAPVAATSRVIISPGNQHAREPLEAYPLNTLRWVGTLRQNDRVWALIQTHEGTVHRVQTGSYLGENSGQLVGIDTSRLAIREIEYSAAGDQHEYIKYIDAKQDAE